MQVTNEIRLAFLHAMWTEKVSPVTFSHYMTVAFEARESEELLHWMTIYEKVRFGNKLLELTAVSAVQKAFEAFEKQDDGMTPLHDERDLDSDLTEDR